MSKVFLRTAFNYDVDAVSNETGFFSDEPSLAQQSMLEETDINTIVYRFGLTGTLPNAVHAPVYGDFTGISDYQSALQAIMDADESFMAMPADIRARFGNDPQQFVEFCSDSANLEEMRSLGLAVPETVVTQPEASPAVPTSESASV